MRRLPVAPAALLVLVACGPPITIVRLNPRAVDRELTATVLLTGELSSITKAVLQRRALGDAFARFPDEALARLLAVALGPDGRASDFFALAETSFARAETTGAPETYLAAALYALTFLSPDVSDALDRGSDPRARIACDLYNRALASALEDRRTGFVTPAAGTFTLPFGTLEIAFSEQELVLGDRWATRFDPVAEYGVRGLRTRHRRAGIGAPLGALTAPLDPHDPMARWVGPKMRVPMTAVLHVDDPRRQIAAGRVQGTLQLYLATDEPTTELFGRRVPLELEPTSSLAAALSEAPVWKRELRGFLGFPPTDFPVPFLGGIEPYRPGRIPVVLVHGTASSPGRWAELVNELQSDPALYGRFQYWYFLYDTDNPIAYSAMLLRDAITNAVAHFDPDGRDPALRRMVVIGHSQGGLLTKLTAIDSGNRLWPVGEAGTPEELDASPETRALLRDIYFVTPLPFVRRVVFMATPHRGSFVAGWGIARFVSRLTRRPGALVRLASERAIQRLLTMTGRESIPTAVDNMSPHSAFVRALADIPMADGVVANSIVAVKGSGPVETGNDGVVEYTSAHRDDVESEVVIRSPHSVQGNPRAIAEVRRILLHHLATSTGPQPEGAAD